MLNTNILPEIGLTENESRAYFALLEKGAMTPPEIADLLKIKRVTAYAVLKSICQKNLAEEKVSKRKLIYRPLPPTNLLESIESKKGETERAEKSLRAILPQLTGIFNLTSSKPGIVYFEGIQGIKKTYEELLKEKPEEVLVFRSVFDKQRLGPYLSGYTKRRALLGIKTKIISPTVPTKEKREKDIAYLRERKYIPEPLFTVGTQIDIYNDKVSFITLDKSPMGFIIISKGVSDTMRTIFELVWNSDTKN